MSKYLLQWLKRTRMAEGMIWNTYYKHRKKELRERFPHIGRIGTNKNIMTYLLIRKWTEDGLNYYILSEEKGKYVPIQTVDPFGNYYVESISYEFPNGWLNKYTINCYCSKRLCRNPYIEVPALHFRISCKQWSENDVIDFLDHLPEFFLKWNREMRLIEHEIPKIQKMCEMKKLRSKLLGMRKLESFIESRYQGLCELKGRWITVIVPLSDGHNLTFTIPFLYHIPNWWERIQEMVNAFTGYFQKQIDEGLLDLDSFPKGYICDSYNLWFDGYYTRIHNEGLEAMTKKKGWRKWCPMRLEIA